MNISTELFLWLNKQTDIQSHNVDLIDGFLFMLQKINRHQSIRLIGNQQIHPRFWRSHDRTFGYKLMTKNKRNKNAHLYQFYLDVAFAEQFIQMEQECIRVTQKGKCFLEKEKEEQLDLLFTYIW